MSRLGFYFDARMCMGCRTCQVACKDKNNLKVDDNFRKVRTIETGVYPHPHTFHYSGACHHCAEAKCVEGCPVGAMYYAKDGTVQIDKESCIACRCCVDNCPYGAVLFQEAQWTAAKCDSCADLRAGGENPACVDACPMRCLKFEDLVKLEEQYGPDLVCEMPILPSAALTKPSLLIKIKACCLDRRFRELVV